MLNPLSRIPPPIQQSKSGATNTGPRLATRIKTKYPGEYDDLDDDELERRIVAKYPGEYDDLVGTKPPEPAKGKLSNIPGADTLWNAGSRIVDFGKSFLTSPGIQGNEFIALQKAARDNPELQKKLEEELKQTSLRHPLSPGVSQTPYSFAKNVASMATPMGTGAMPFDIGEQTAEDLRTGNYGGMLGTAAVVGGGAYLGYRGMGGGKNKLAASAAYEHPSLPDSPYNVPRYENPSVPSAPYNVPPPTNVQLPPYLENPSVPNSPYNVPQNLPQSPWPQRQLPPIGGTGLTRPTTSAPSSLFPEGGPSYLRGPRTAPPIAGLLPEGQPIRNTPFQGFSPDTQPVLDPRNPSNIDIFGQGIDVSQAAQNTVRYPPAQPGFNPALQRPGTTMPLGRPVTPIPPPPVVAPPVAPVNQVPIPTGAKPVKAPAVRVAKGPQPVKPPKPIPLSKLSDVQIAERVRVATPETMPLLMAEIERRTKRAAREEARAAKTLPAIQPVPDAIPPSTLPPVEPVKAAIPEPVVGVVPPVEPVTIPKPEPLPPVAPVAGIVPDTPAAPAKVAKKTLKAPAEPIELMAAKTKYQVAVSAVKSRNTPANRALLNEAQIELAQATKEHGNHPTVKAKAAGVEPEPIVEIPATEEVGGVTWNRTPDKYVSGEYEIFPNRRESPKAGPNDAYRATGKWDLVKGGKPVKSGLLKDLQAEVGKLEARSVTPEPVVTAPKERPFKGKTPAELREIAKTADEATGNLIREEFAAQRKEKASGSTLASDFASIQNLPRQLKHEYDQWRVLKELPENKESFARFVEETGKGAEYLSKQVGKGLPEVDTSVVKSESFEPDLSRYSKNQFEDFARGADTPEVRASVEKERVRRIEESRQNMKTAELRERDVERLSTPELKEYRQYAESASTRAYVNEELQKRLSRTGGPSVVKSAWDSLTPGPVGESGRTMIRRANNELRKLIGGGDPLEAVDLHSGNTDFFENKLAPVRVDYAVSSIRDSVKAIKKNQGWESIPGQAVEMDRVATELTKLADRLEDPNIPAKTKYWEIVENFHKQEFKEPFFDYDKARAEWIAEDAAKNPKPQELPKVDTSVVKTTPSGKPDLSKMTTDQLAEYAKTATKSDDVLALRAEMRNRRGRGGTTLSSGGLGESAAILKKEYDQWRVLKNLPENQKTLNQFLEETGKLAGVAKWAGPGKEVSIPEPPGKPIPKGEYRGFGTPDVREPIKLDKLDYQDLPTASKIKTGGPSVSNVKRGPADKILWKDEERPRVGRRLEPADEAKPGQRFEPRQEPKPMSAAERFAAGLGEKHEGMSTLEILKKADAERKADLARHAEGVTREAERIKAEKAKELAKANKVAEKSMKAVAKEQKKAKMASRTVDDVIAEKIAKHPVTKTSTFKGAVKALPERFRNNALYRAIYEPAGVSSLTKLKRLGEGGRKLAKVVADERTESNRYGGQHELVTRKVIRSLSDAEQAEVVKLLDGQIDVSDASSQKVVEGYKNIRASLDELGDRAEALDVRMKDPSGKTVSFEKFKGEYFPHQYPPELFKDPVALKEKLLKHGKDKQGNPLSPAAVDAIMKNVVEKGERFSSPQHARTLNLPGYIESLEAVIKHQKEMAKVITRAERYGPLNVADTNSPLSKLIRESSNSTKAEKIINDYLERVEHTPERESQQRVSNIIVQAEVASKLSQFGITNMGDLAGTNSALGIKNTHKAIYDLLADPHGSVDIAVGSGSHAILNNELVHDVGAGKFLGKAYGTATTEKVIRTIGTLAGRTEVQRLFALAKKDKKYAKTLADFVDGDVNDVLKQDSLTRKQIDFAGGRAVEMTSGIPDKLGLSKAMFSDNPLLRLPFLFKRFAFLNTRNMANVIKRQPDFKSKLGKAAVIIGTYQVAGEAIGDAKKAIEGLVAGDVGEAISERGDYVGTGNKAFDRIMANFLQSALFGVVGDVSESIARKRTGQITGTLAGPIGSDADELARIVTSAFFPSKEAKEKGERFKPLGKAIARRIPYVGAGLAKRWYKEEKASGGLSGLSSSKPSGLSGLGGR